MDLGYLTSGQLRGFYAALKPQLEAVSDFHEPWSMPALGAMRICASSLFCFVGCDWPPCLPNKRGLQDTIWSNAICIIRGGAV